MGVKFKFIIMKTLEEQINWLSNHITYLNFLKEIYSKERIKIEGIPPIEANKEINSQIIEFSSILDYLLILNDRDCLCDNCVNNYFEQITKES